MAQQGDFEGSYAPLTGDEIILANQAGSTLDLVLRDIWQGMFKRQHFSIGGTTSDYVLLPETASIYSEYIILITTLEDGKWRQLDLGVSRNLQVVGSTTQVRINYEAVVPLPTSTYLNIYEMTGWPSFA